MSKPVKKIVHEANPENWGITKKIGHEIDKHVFNGQWTKGWRQGLSVAGIAAAAILTGGAAAGALGASGIGAGATAAGAAGAAAGATGAAAGATGAGAAAGMGAVAGYAAAAGVAAGAYGAKQGHDTYVAERQQAKAEAEANAARDEAERQATAERTAQLKGLKKQLVPVLKGSAVKGAASSENVSGIVLG